MSQALAAEAHVLGHPATAEFWPETDRNAVILKEALLEQCPDFIQAHVGGHIYETLVQRALDDTVCRSPASSPDRCDCEEGSEEG